MFRRSPSVVERLALAAAGITLIGVIDFLSGLEIRIFPLYFGPVAYVSAGLGARPGIAVSFVCAMTWLLSNLAAGSHHPVGLLAANAALQLTACAFVAVLIARMRALLQSEQAHARNDTLTGLPNRRALLERAALEYARLQRGSTPLTVACIDLDRFKSVNDSGGHAAGDRLLQHVGRVIQERLRGQDLVARIGGDEFILLLPDTGSANAQEVLERLRAWLSSEVAAMGAPVTASIGAAVVFPPGLETLDVALRRADAALYQAKQGGRNRVCIATDLDAATEVSHMKLL